MWICVESKSMEELGSTAPLLSKKMCETVYKRLLQDPEDQQSELVDLNHAPSVKHLPPAYIVTAEYDPLRDEAEYYAARLFKNGVTVSLTQCLLQGHSILHCLPSHLSACLMSACLCVCHLCLWAAFKS